MTRRPFLRVALATIATSLLANGASAQTFPSQPLTLIVPSPAGDWVDSAARLLSDPLAGILGLRVVIENRSGGSGTLAYGRVARSKANGHTLLIAYSAFHVGPASLTSKRRWRDEDFVPVALIGIAPHVVCAHPSVPATTLADFIAYLEQNPGKLRYASEGKGSLAHIGTEMFMSHTGTQMVHAPSRDVGLATQGVVSGRTQVFLAALPTVVQQVQAGALKGYAVTGRARHQGLPLLPTTAEAGLKGFELEAWVAVFAPAGTPDDVVRRLTTSLQQALDQPGTQTRAAAAGIELHYLPPDALGEKVRQERQFWSRAS